MVSKFSKRYGSTYICSSCGKRTRETGEEEISVEMCAYCYLLYSWGNSVSDTPERYSLEDYAKDIAVWQKKYKRTDLPEGITNGSYSLEEIAEAVKNVA